MSFQSLKIEEKFSYAGFRFTKVSPTSARAVNGRVIPFVSSLKVELV